MFDNVVVFRVGSRLVALATEHVDESMRPLPCESLPGVPAFVRGAAIVRGTPTVVVDLRELLGEDSLRAPARMLLLRTGGLRRIAVLVDEVLGVRDGRRLEAVEELPPLLGDAEDAGVRALARLDGRLLTVFRSGRFVSDDVLQRLGSSEAAG
jgi:chemotaxis signal transduction protein